VHQNGTDKDKLTHSGVHGAARKVQSAFDIYIAIKVELMIFILTMNTRGKVNYCVHADKRGPPIRRGSDRLDQNFVVAS
jgi:hypothetical protein